MNETLVGANSSASLHLHVISMHTSPLAQPGQGDAGGMNVYIDRSLSALLSAFPQLTVEVFTLATAPAACSREQVSDRAVVHFIELKEALGATKDQLPRFVAAFAEQVSRRARKAPDVIHSHYWLSGMAALIYSQGTPLVHTMHTTAAAKDARAGAGETKEPKARYAGEQHIVKECAALVVNTEFERHQMIDYYRADPQKISIIEPGVDTRIFRPLENEYSENAGSNHRAHLVFAGRPQPLKGPQILIEALAQLPTDVTVKLTMIGRSGTDFEEQLIERAKDLGISSQVRLLDPVSSRELARIFRSADIVACPSSSETFGLVALEAQACGTPVIATRADGLQAAVEDQKSGILVSSREPEDWAQAIAYLVRNPDLRSQMGAYAHQRAAQKTWGRTAQELMSLYTAVKSHPHTSQENS